MAPKNVDRSLPSSGGLETWINSEAYTSSRFRSSEIGRFCLIGCMLRSKSKAISNREPVPPAAEQFDWLIQKAFLFLPWGNFSEPSSRNRYAQSVVDGSLWTCRWTLLKNTTSKPTNRMFRKVGASHINRTSSSVYRLIKTSRALSIYTRPFRS